MDDSRLDAEAEAEGHALVEFLRFSGVRLANVAEASASAVQLLDGLDAHMSAALENDTMRESLSRWPRKISRPSRKARKSLHAVAALCLRQADEIDDLLRAILDQIEKP